MSVSLIQNPGIYPGPGQASLLRANEQQWLFQNNLIAGGGTVALNGSNPSASIAVQLERKPGVYYPFGVSLQVFFTNVSGAAANPGAFEIDLQTSDIDQDSQYVPVLTGLTTGLNASFAGRIESSTLWTRYARAYVKTLTNAVYSSILITR